MEYYFDRDDRLERKKYAEFLETLLLNCDQYRREDSEGAYVIALDSPWGTGKTRFVKMLRNYLEGNKPRIINGKVDRAYTPKLNEDRLFNVVYYNAWDTDFSTDALEPLFYSLLKSPELAPDQFDAAGNEILEKFENATKEMLKAAGYALSHFVLGEAATTVLKSGIDAICAKQPNPYENYEKRLELISNFRKALTAVIDATKQKRLVIIVDELDRCRPTFAIETLEIAKHLFAVDNLAFIFALDVEQLDHSVKTMYGANMDGFGYLLRFFDYKGTLPKPKMELFLDTYLDDIIPTTNLYAGDDFKKFLNIYICDLQISFSLSLREVVSVLSSYKILNSTFLKKYCDVTAHEIYLFLLVMKYKRPHEFRRLLEGNMTFRQIENEYSENVLIGSNAAEPTSRRIKFFSNRMQIKDISFEIYNFVKFSKTSEKRFLRFIASYNENKESELHYLLIPGKNNEPGGYEFRREESLSQILYFNDLLKWDEIKDLTICQYYFRQLEMFDFVLPADEAKA